ncbi:MAG TPA: pyridoxal-phosphate dependent enzyme [Bacilli bacterium]|nr:pyridoxal-phosphate dependent enzyme [Bacilli bacterium]
MYTWNENVSGLICLRCERVYEVGDYATGCPDCLQAGFPVSLALQYKQVDLKQDHKATGLMNYKAMLPYQTFPTLGEGATPLLALDTLAQELGLGRLSLKNEGQNPTGSHKDRMSPLAVARAASSGFDTVVAASTGNQGTSLAAYAARAGLRCVVVVTQSVNPIWLQAMIQTGAQLVAVNQAKDRWAYIKERVCEDGWFPVTNYIDPPVGSNPYGVQGYKTLAYELVEQCDPSPTVIVVPTSRGDLLWGIWEGLKEAHRAGMLTELPRMVAVEPFPRLQAVQNGMDYRQNFAGESSLLPSISGTTVTYQALQVLQQSQGLAVAVSGEEAERAQVRLGQEGLYLERSSATVLTAVEKLVQEKRIGADDRVVMIGTSNGYKEMTLREPYTSYLLEPESSGN